MCSAHIAGDIAKGVLIMQCVDTWKLAVNGTKQPKPRFASRGDQEKQSLSSEKNAPIATKSACKFLLLRLSNR